MQATVHAWHPAYLRVSITMVQRRCSAGLVMARTSSRCIRISGSSSDCSRMLLRTVRCRTVLGPTGSRAGLHVLARISVEAPTAAPAASSPAAMAASRCDIAGTGPAADDADAASDMNMRLRPTYQLIYGCRACPRRFAETSPRGCRGRGARTGRRSEAPVGVTWAGAGSAARSGRGSAARRAPPAREAPAGAPPLR